MTMTMEDRTQLDLTVDAALAAEVRIPRGSALFRAPNLLVLVMNEEFAITEILGDTSEWGMSREEALGRSVLDFIVPEDAERVISAYLLVSEVKELPDGEYDRARWLTADLTLVNSVGERLPASVSIHPVDGEYVVMVRVEPTAQNRHESLRRLAESTSLRDQLEAACSLVNSPHWFTGFVSFPPNDIVVWPHAQLPEELVHAGVWRSLIRDRTPMVSSAMVAQPYRGIAEAHGLQSLYAHPLHVPGREHPLGVMVSWTVFPEAVPVAGIDRLIEESRWIATLAMSQHETMLRLECLATRDTLTDLPNRAGLERHLRLLGGRDIAVLYLDLDGFKGVNDRFGHAAGDEVLIEVAERLALTVGERGFISRLGGDEFCVVVTDAETELAIAEDIRVAFGAPIRASGDEGVGVSIGVSRRGSAGDAWRLLREADEEMLARKAHRVESRFRRGEG